MNSDDKAVERLESCVRTHLPDDLNRSGAVLYSTKSSFGQSPLFIVATNPGGSDAELSGAKYEIRNRIFAKEHELTKGWKPNGEFTQLQKQLKELIEKSLKIQDIQSVPYTNLIFMRTPNTFNLDWSLAEKCWPINNLILDIIHPRLVITVGNAVKNSPYTFLKKTLGNSDEKEKPSGQMPQFILRYSVINNGDKQFGVLGLPHLSRYAITNYPDDLNWVADRAKEAGLL